MMDVVHPSNMQLRTPNGRWHRVATVGGPPTVGATLVQTVPVPNARALAYDRGSAVGNRMKE